ncbi:FMN-dependent NADH-azoreductase [Jannaschia sp. W003]|uniref:FMN-dependent NADH-azoreductase n=1 Tax=Jannaschia sp. W003 TaxID=2867012 RepID=UPI0021A54065|nr:NAD(P)H-dependent oxidoreductase [Jannaschia sp. W003]UWQ22226.1 NAD(P)H-dependent oxidoreductase [Jannaschia sp. W003]
MTTLRIDSSARHDGSVTRQILDRVEARIGAADVRRDLAETPLPQVTGTWTAANFTPKDQRTPEQHEALRQSDALIAELRAADTILIGAPVYNFAVAASLKAWIDLVARAGETFRYTENGPEGLLGDKRVIVAVASGGTPVGSDYDFLSGYLRFILGFMGIRDVTFVDAAGGAVNPDAAFEKADREIEALAA